MLREVEQQKQQQQIAGVQIAQMQLFQQIVEESAFRGIAVWRRRGRRCVVGGRLTPGRGILVHGNTGIGTVIAADIAVIQADRLLPSEIAYQW